MSDWTEYFDQNKISSQANKMVDDIIESLYKSKLQLQTIHHLSQFEIALLYRFPIYIGVNLFIERSLRITASHRNGDTYDFPLTEHMNNYFKNTLQSVQAYYYDFSINYRLLNDLSEIISNPRSVKKMDPIDFPRPQETLVQKANDGIGDKQCSDLYISWSGCSNG